MIRTQIVAEAAQMVQAKQAMAATTTTSATATTSATQVGQAAQSGQTATVGAHYAAALPGEWLMLWVLFAMAAVLGAAVLAGGAVGHRRLQELRVQQWREWRRRRPDQEERPGGRDCG